MARVVKDNPQAAEWGVSFRHFANSMSVAIRLELIRHRVGQHVLVIASRSCTLGELVREYAERGTVELSSVSFPETVLVRVSVRLTGPLLSTLEAPMRRKVQALPQSLTGAKL